MATKKTAATETTEEVKEEKKPVAKKTTTAKKATTTKTTATKKPAAKKTETAETPVEAPVKAEAKAEKKPAKEKKATVKKVEKKFNKATVGQFDTIICPVITEKSMAQMQNQNKVTVKVVPTANRAQIKLAFEAIFKVSVKEVNIVNVLSKYKKAGRYEGTVPAYKKAIVTLEDGEALDLFKE